MYIEHYYFEDGLEEELKSIIISPRIMAQEVWQKPKYIRTLIYVAFSCTRAGYYFTHGIFRKEGYETVEAKEARQSIAWLVKSGYVKAETKPSHRGRYKISLTDKAKEIIRIKDSKEV